VTSSLHKNVSKLEEVKLHCVRQLFGSIWANEQLTITKCRGFMCTLFCALQVPLAIPGGYVPENFQTVNNKTGISC
jgi:hypothetical protein